MSSLFKSIVRNDIKNTFLNSDEFSDIHEIDGKKMPVIFDKNELTDRTQSSDHTDGLYGTSTLIYVSSKDFGPAPRPGNVITVDRRRQFIVVDCINEDGIYSITMEANRA